MSEKTMLQKVSAEACRFIYKNYDLDEITNGKDTVMYCEEDKMIFAIYLREDRFDFVIILSEKEREFFESKPVEFPQRIFEIYDDIKKWNDGKWIEIPVFDFETWEDVKQIILIKKKPNRIPFPKDTAVYSKCGMRCDLCVHYTGGNISEEFREELKQRVGSVFGYEDYSENMMLCPGCFNKDSDGCGKLDCAKNKGIKHCLECGNYPCFDCGLLNVDLQGSRSTSSKTLTWAILPYVGGLN